MQAATAAGHAAAAAAAHSSCPLCPERGRAAMEAVLGHSAGAAVLLPAAAHTLLPPRPLFERRPLLEHMPLSNWKMQLISAAPDGRSLFIGSESQILMLPLNAAGVPRIIEPRVSLDAAPRVCVECGAAATVQCAECNCSYDEQHFRTVHAGNWAMMQHFSRAHQVLNTAAAADATDSDISALIEGNDGAAGDASVGPVPITGRPRAVRNDDVSSLYHVLTMPPAEAADPAAAMPSADPPRLADLTGIRIGYVGSRPVLAATSMEGHCCLFDLQRLSQHRFGAGSGTGTAGAPSEADLVQQLLRPRWEDNSAWSIAFSPRGSPRPTVYVGSNAARAFLWPLATPADADPATEPPSYVLAGHNVPGVDVSSCGRYLAMSCIDTVLRVAKLTGSDKDGRYLAVKDVDDAWGWGVRWVPRWAVRQRSETYAQLDEHLKHAPPVPWLQRLLEVEPPGGAAEDPMVAHMVEQLMLQLGPNVPPAAQQALRADLRRQVVHMLRVRQQQRHEDAEEDADDAADEEFEFEAEVDMDEEEQHEDEEEEEEGEDAAEEEDVAHASDGEGGGDGGAAAAAAPAPAGARAARAAHTSSESGGSVPELLTDDENPLDEDVEHASEPSAPREDASDAETASEGTTDLLIYSSKSHVYLMDSRLNVLAYLKNVCEPTLTLHRALHRLLFVEALPSLGLVLLASSASDRVLLVRLERFACGRYAMRIERALPETSCGVPIKGVTFCRVPTASTSTSPEEQAQAAATTLAAELEQMRSANAAAPKGTEPPPLPSPPPAWSHPGASEQERWRIYILFADERLAAYEIAQTPAAQPFDIASFVP